MRRAVDIACACKGAKDRKTYQVKLPGGLKVTKTSLEAATMFAAKHPGATIIKPGA